MFNKIEIDLAKPAYEALKEIAKRQGKKWEWEPEIGEWCLWKNQPHIVLEPEEQDNWITLFVGKDEAYYRQLVVPMERCVPLLRWEKLEKILESLGYVVMIYQDRCEIWAEDNTGMRLRVRRKGRSRQEAVMRAVIKLGEEEKIKK